MRTFHRGYYLLSIGSIAAAALLAASFPGAPDAHASTQKTHASTRAEPSNSQGIPEYAIAESRQLQPLRDIAAALADEGRTGKFAAKYVNVRIDSTRNIVTLLVTDPSAAPRIIRAAQAAHPGINTALIRIGSGKYPRQTLDHAMAKILASDSRA